MVKILRFSKKRYFQNSGFCPICKKNVEFVATNNWFRDNYICTKCGSIPRERAIMSVIDTWMPDWRLKSVHESSPINRGASVKISSECKNYIPSQFFPGMKLGSLIDGVRCENLENLTFENESIDLHITQDVFEHLFFPDRAFKEIARTLKSGGLHIFSVPLVNRNRLSEVRAELDEVFNEIKYIKPPEYHGNPINEKGSLVTYDWGFDICQKIFEASGLFTHIIVIDDLSKGIRAELNEILVTIKP